MSNETTMQMTRAFDELAGAYDHEHHDAVARALLEFMGSPLDGRAADVACGGGAAALALAATRAAGQRGDVSRVAPILAIDLSPAMIATGRTRAEQAGHTEAIDWRIGSALPLPVDDGTLDLIVCASSLHFLGAAAPADWVRALRRGGRVGFTMPTAGTFRPRGTFAQLVAEDLPLPADALEASRLAADAGFTDARARIATVGSREVALVTGINR
jgi:ubiquinone/menaquinone biosynthesis C-methylase UbiE